MAQQPHAPAGPGHRRHRRHRAGITLLEVLIVVAIVGIATSIALPQIERALTRSRVTAAADSLRTLHRSMTDWAKEQGSFPTKPEFHKRDLQPMVKDGTLEKGEAAAIVRGFAGRQVYAYTPDADRSGYVIYVRLPTSAYMLRMESGEITKRDTSQGGSTWTPIDDWTNE